MHFGGVQPLWSLLMFHGYAIAGYFESCVVVVKSLMQCVVICPPKGDNELLSLF